MDRGLREHRGSTTTVPGARAEGTPRLTISILSGLFLLTSLFALPAYASSPDGNRSPSWKEVLSFAPVNPGPVTWCSPKVLVAKEYDQFEQAGGIVHINVETKKVTWVTKNPLTKDPFCNYDGTTIFYYRLRENPKIEPEGLEFDGVWAYDLKTKKTNKIGTLSPDKVAINLTSPAQNIYALVARDRKYLPELKINLPGWRILRLPADDRLQPDGSLLSQWARDGSYLALTVRDKNKPTERHPFHKVGILVFLDPEGRQLSKVPYAALQQEPGVTPYFFAASGDGLYFFGKDGRLRKVNPRTGGIEQSPLQVTLKEKHSFTFDVASTGEVIYTKLDDIKSGERPLLWLTTVSGKPSYSLGILAHHPRLSPMGDYLAVIQRGNRGNGVLTVLQRPANPTDR